MATPIKRIEKDFLLKVLYDEQIPVMYLKAKTQYTLMVEKPTKGQMFFKADRPIDGIKNHKKLDLMFDNRGQVITFSVKIIEYKDEHIVTMEPEILYKNLDRSFSRVSTPTDLQVQFTFLGDRYSLTYPKVTEYDTLNPADLVNNSDPKNLRGLIEQMAQWIKNYATSYKLIFFKETKPATTEEKLLAESGKALFLPSTLGTFPPEDPYPKKRIITKEIFHQYLESTGVDPKYLDEACARFVGKKNKAGVFSDLWVPILFHEYVIGYIHIWISEEGMTPFDYTVIENMFQFSQILAYSLKLNGYFESGKLRNEPFEGKIIDISASGLLFTYPNSTFADTIIPDSELAIQLKTDRRTVNTKAKIVRRYKDKIQGYFGCSFVELEPEDLRFLFEFIYGKTFTDEDAAFFSGQV
jgi:hypothetical protein